MSFDVLLSIMNTDNYKYIDTLNIKSNCVVINQTNCKNFLEIQRKNQRIKFISTKERGLSRSRNMAIRNSDSDICILCDNDIEYIKGYEKVIEKAFSKYIEYDVILFFVQSSPNKKLYYDKPKEMNWISVNKFYSPEIAFRRKKILENNIFFDEKFGAGSKFRMGEENIFLYDCLRKNLKILYLPIKIAEERTEVSTWFKGYTNSYFYDRGAVFTRMSNKYSGFLIFQFLIRKYKLYKKDTCLYDALKYMLKGRKDFYKDGKI